MFYKISVGYFFLQGSKGVRGLISQRFQEIGPDKVAEHGEALAHHTVYLAPDDQHLGVAGRGTVALSAAPPVGGFRPSGTFLFDSVARAFGPAAVAVILTGMGEDGVAGLHAIRQAGERSSPRTRAARWCSACRRRRSGPA